MPWYKNRGARFTTLDGRHVGTGDLFEAEPTDADVVRRPQKLVRVTDAEAAHHTRRRSTTSLPIDTWRMTVDEARPVLSSMDGTPELFRALHDREQARPNGPRKGILDALEERIGEQSVEEPAEGTARAPAEAEED